MGNVQLHKRYFQVYDAPRSWSTKFTRTAITRQDQPNAVVVVYEGDEAQAVDIPHGNAKQQRALARPFVRTQPHVVKNIQTQASTADGPRDVYRKMVSTLLR